MFHTLSSKFRQMVILLALFAVVLPAQTESSFSEDAQKRRHTIHSGRFTAVGNRHK